MDTPLVLIGPQRSGKHTIGRLVATHLDGPLVDVDTIAPKHGAEIGYGEQAARAAWKEGGLDGYYHGRATQRRSRFPSDRTPREQ